jgi:glycosyltransferase involved in cell wall biosynthesis
MNAGVDHPDRSPDAGLRAGAGKALILLPHDSPGGAERVTMIVAEAAIRSKMFSEVVVFVASRGDNGTLAHLSNAPNARLVFSLAKRQISGIHDLLRICRQGPYDFVFSSLIVPNALAALFRRLGVLNARRLVARESTTIFERDFGWKATLIRGLYRLYGPQDLIVSQTDRMAQSLNLNTKDRLAHLIQTIPNPLPFSIADRMAAQGPTARSASDLRIVWCGRLSAVKSPLRAVETLACLHRMGRPDARLLMIGDGPMRAETESLAQTLGLGGLVEFSGFVPRPIDLMQACNVGLMTSDVEGFPNVILEMLSTGMAGVATTDCAGGLGDIPGVIVSREKSPQALADSVLMTLTQGDQSDAVREFLMERNPISFFKQLLVQSA